MSKRKAKFRVGQTVEWLGQEGRCQERIVAITYPQPGNAVLWTTLDGEDKQEWLFPINAKQVRLVRRERGGR